MCGHAAARKGRRGGSEGMGRTASTVGPGGQPEGCKLKVWAKLEGDQDETGSPEK